MALLPAGAVPKVCCGGAAPICWCASPPEVPIDSLASGADDMAVKLWDPNTGAERLTINGHTGEVLALAFSPGGKLLVSGGRDGAVRIWNAADGQSRGTLKNHKDAHHHLDAIRLALEAGATREDKLALVYQIVENAPGPMTNAPESVTILWRAMGELQASVTVA